MQSIINKKRYRLIIFDWDGTLLDSASNIINSIKKTTQSMALPSIEIEKIRQVIGLRFDVALKRLLPQLTDEEKVQFNKHYRQNYAQCQQTTNACQLFPNVVDLLTELKRQHYLIAIATSKHRLGFNRDLDCFQLQRLINTSKCGDEGPSKPNPQMIKDILATLSVTCHEAILVGDTPYDLKMATSAGIDAIAVTSGTSDKQHLLACQPIHCMDTIKELLFYLKIKR